MKLINAIAQSGCQECSVIREKISVDEFHLRRALGKRPVLAGCTWSGVCRDDVWMADVEVSGGLVSGPRRRRSAVERRRIVEETLEAGASVARVALKYGVNANQVFQWRRLHRDDKLGTTAEPAMKLLPVSIAEEIELRKPDPSQVETGKVWCDPYRVAGQGADQFGRQRRCCGCPCGVEEPALMIGLPTGTRIWIAAGVTDMRRGLSWPECAGADGA